MTSPKHCSAHPNMANDQRKGKGTSREKQTKSASSKDKSKMDKAPSKKDTKKKGEPSKKAETKKKSVAAKSKSPLKKVEQSKKLEIKKQVTPRKEVGKKADTSKKGEISKKAEGDKGKKTAASKKVETEKSKKTVPDKKLETDKDKKSELGKKGEADKVKQTEPGKKGETDKDKKTEPSKRGETERNRKTEPIKKVETEKNTKNELCKKTEKDKGKKAEVSKKVDTDKNKKTETCKKTEPEHGKKVETSPKTETEKMKTPESKVKAETGKKEGISTKKDSKKSTPLMSVISTKKSESKKKTEPPKKAESPKTKESTQKNDKNKRVDKCKEDNVKTFPSESPKKKSDSKKTAPKPAKIVSSKGKKIVVKKPAPKPKKVTPEIYKNRHNIGRRTAAERVGSYSEAEVAIVFPEGYWDPVKIETLVGEEHAEDSKPLIKNRHKSPENDKRKSLSPLSSAKKKSAANNSNCSSAKKMKGASAGKDSSGKESETVSNSEGSEEDMETDTETESDCDSTYMAPVKKEKGKRSSSNESISRSRKTGKYGDIVPRAPRIKRTACLNAGAIMSIMYEKDEPVLKKSKLDIPETSNASTDYSQGSTDGVSRDSDSSSDMEYKPAKIKSEKEQKRKVNLSVKLSAKKIASKIKDPKKNIAKKKNAKKKLDGRKKKDKDAPLYTPPRRMASLNAQAIWAATKDDRLPKLPKAKPKEGVCKTKPGREASPNKDKTEKSPSTSTHTSPESTKSSTVETGKDREKTKSETANQQHKPDASQPPSTHVISSTKPMTLQPGMTSPHVQFLSNMPPGGSGMSRPTPASSGMGERPPIPSPMHDRSMYMNRTPMPTPSPDIQILEIKPPMGTPMPPGFTNIPPNSRQHQFMTSQSGNMYPASYTPHQERFQGQSYPHPQGQFPMPPRPQRPYHSQPYQHVPQSHSQGQQSHSMGYPPTQGPPNYSQPSMQGHLPQSMYGQPQGPEMYQKNSSEPQALSPRYMQPRMPGQAMSSQAPGPHGQPPIHSQPGQMMQQMATYQPRYQPYQQYQMPSQTRTPLPQSSPQVQYPSSSNGSSQQSLPPNPPGSRTPNNPAQVQPPASFPPSTQVGTPVTRPKVEPTTSMSPSQRFTVRPDKPAVAYPHPPPVMSTGAPPSQQLQSQQNQQHHQPQQNHQQQPQQSGQQQQAPPQQQASHQQQRGGGASSSGGSVHDQAHNSSPMGNTCTYPYPHSTTDVPPANHCQSFMVGSVTMETNSGYPVMPFRHYGSAFTVPSFEEAQQIRFGFYQPAGPLIQAMPHDPCCVPHPIGMPHPQVKVLVHNAPPGYAADPQFGNMIQPKPSSMSGDNAGMSASRSQDRGPPHRVETHEASTSPGKRLKEERKEEKPEKSQKSGGNKGESSGGMDDDGEKLDIITIGEMDSASMRAFNNRQKKSKKGEEKKESTKKDIKAEAKSSYSPDSGTPRNEGTSSTTLTDSGPTNKSIPDSTKVDTGKKSQPSKHSDAVKDEPCKSKKRKEASSDAAVKHSQLSEVSPSKRAKIDSKASHTEPKEPKTPSIERGVVNSIESKNTQGKVKEQSGEKTVPAQQKKEKESKTTKPVEKNIQKEVKSTVAKKIMPSKDRKSTPVKYAPAGCAKPKNAKPVQEESPKKKITPGTKAAVSGDPKTFVNISTIQIGKTQSNNEVSMPTHKPEPLKIPQTSDTTGNTAVTRTNKDTTKKGNGSAKKDGVSSTRGSGSAGKGKAKSKTDTKTVASPPSRPISSKAEAVAVSMIVTGKMDAVKDATSPRADRQCQALDLSSPTKNIPKPSFPLNVPLENEPLNLVIHTKNQQGSSELAPVVSSTKVSTITTSGTPGKTNKKGTTPKPRRASATVTGQKPTPKTESRPASLPGSSKDAIAKLREYRPVISTPSSNVEIRPKPAPSIHTPVQTALFPGVMGMQIMATPNLQIPGQKTSLPVSGQKITVRRPSGDSSGQPKSVSSAGVLGHISATHTLQSPIRTPVTAPTLLGIVRPAQPGPLGLVQMQTYPSGLISAASMISQMSIAGPSRIAIAKSSTQTRHKPLQPRPSTVTNTVTLVQSLPFTATPSAMMTTAMKTKPAVTLCQLSTVVPSQPPAKQILPKSSSTACSQSGTRTKATIGIVQKSANSLSKPASTCTSLSVTSMATSTTTSPSSSSTVAKPSPNLSTKLHTTDGVDEKKSIVPETKIPSSTSAPLAGNRSTSYIDYTNDPCSSTSELLRRSEAMAVSLGLVRVSATSDKASEEVLSSEAVPVSSSSLSITASSCSLLPDLSTESGHVSKPSVISKLGEQPLVISTKTTTTPSVTEKSDNGTNQKDQNTSPKSIADKDTTSLPQASLPGSDNSSSSSVVPTAEENSTDEMGKNESLEGKTKTEVDNVSEPNAPSSESYIKKDCDLNSGNEEVKTDGKLDPSVDASEKDTASVVVKDKTVPDISTIANKSVSMSSKPQEVSVEESVSASTPQKTENEALTSGNQPKPLKSLALEAASLSNGKADKLSKPASKTSEKDEFHAVKECDQNTVPTDCEKQQQFISGCHENKGKDCVKTDCVSDGVEKEVIPDLKDVQTQECEANDKEPAVKTVAIDCDKQDCLSDGLDKKDSPLSTSGQVPDSETDGEKKCTSLATDCEKQSCCSDASGEGSNTVLNKCDNKDCVSASVDTDTIQHDASSSKGEAENKSCSENEVEKPVHSDVQSSDGQLCKEDCETDVVGCDPSSCNNTASGDTDIEKSNSLDNKADDSSLPSGPSSRSSSPKTRSSSGRLPSPGDKPLTSPLVTSSEDSTTLILKDPVLDIDDIDAQLASTSSTAEPEPSTSAKGVAAKSGRSKSPPGKVPSPGKGKQQVSPSLRPRKDDRRSPTNRVQAIHHEQVKKNPSPNPRSRVGVTQAWQWEGEPEWKLVYPQVDLPSVLQECYPAVRHFNGDVIQVRDCVLIRSGPRKRDIPYVAKIAALWKSSESGEMMMNVFWYYRPEHTETDRLLLSTVASEVFASKHRDVIPVACIDDRCYVLTFNEFCRYKSELMRRGCGSKAIVVPPVEEAEEPRKNRQPSLEANPETIFLCRRVYDVKLKRVLKNPQIHTYPPS